MILELNNLIFEARRRQATDPRDRVYGLLAMFNTALGRRMLTADYSKPLEHVYRDFARAFIARSQSLALLMQSSPMTNALKGLPTWVPDLSSRYDFRAEQVRAKAIHQSRFQACRNLDHYSCGSTSDDLLWVKGLLVDHIKCTSDRNDESWDSGNFILQNSSSKALLSWRDLCERGFPAPKVRPYVGGGTVWKAYCTTLTNSRSPQAHDGYDIEELYELIIGSKQENLMILPHSLAVVVGVCTAKRRFFITEKGYVGLGPLDAQMGDEVFILQGGQVPFVLRRFEYQGDLSCRNLVGDCYVHGIMHGEFLGRNEVNKFVNVALK
jgi:hypothetical protein